MGQNVSVIGAGSWGTAIGTLLAKNGNDVYLWDRNEKVLDEIKNIKENSKYLPDIRLPENIIPTSDLGKCVKISDIIVLAVASHAIREVCKKIKPFIDDKQIHKDSEEYVKKMSIKTDSTHQLLVNLSGGNQQKVVISKWLTKDSDIMIFDEPTRGIDVGAKSEIYTLMSDLAKTGKSIIMISSELTEILRMSDRIMVMCEGEKTKELSIEEATQEKILHYATIGREERDHGIEI